MLVRELTGLLNEAYPSFYAEEWDNIGLLVGDPAAEIKGVLLVVDLLPEHMIEAQEFGCNAFIAHHPLIFRPVSSLIKAGYPGDLIFQLIKAETALFAMHTNFDNAAPGVSDYLAERLGFTVNGVLMPKGGTFSYKVVVFTPAESTDKVRSVMATAGAGIIGDYSYCSFKSSGTGSFFPLDKTNPAVGTKGELNEVHEERLEMLVPRSRLAAVLNAMNEAHPYEEVAYDLYPLANQADIGTGRTGVLETPRGLAELITGWKKRLDLQQIRWSGDAGKPISKAAVCGGSVSERIIDAAAGKFDLLVCGEIGYHASDLAKRLSLSVVELGHDVSEALALDGLKKTLEQKTQGSFPIYISDRLPNPLTHWTD